MVLGALSSVSSLFEREPTDDVHLLAVEREGDVARPVAAAAQQAAARDVVDDRLGLAARVEIAVAIGEAHDGVGVADVDPLRIRAGRVERDAERLR